MSFVVLAVVTMIIVMRRVKEAVSLNLFAYEFCVSAYYVVAKNGITVDTTGKKKTRTDASE